MTDTATKTVNTSNQYNKEAIDKARAAFKRHLGNPIEAFKDAVFLIEAAVSTGDTTAIAALFDISKEKQRRQSGIAAMVSAVWPGATKTVKNGKTVFKTAGKKANMSVVEKLRDAADNGFDHLNAKGEITKKGVPVSLDATATIKKVTGERTIKRKVDVKKQSDNYVKSHTKTQCAAKEAELKALLAAFQVARKAANK